MTGRKTLGIRPPGETGQAPAIRRKGRGWAISEQRLDALHDQARELRRHPSEAHKVLAERFAKADLGRHVFKRHAVVGSAIVDFNCHTLGLAIVIDEEGVPEAIATRRDRSLEAVGIRVLHIPAADILGPIDDVLARITTAMRERIADRQAARRAHHASHPRQTAPRGGRPLRKNHAPHR